MVEFTEGKLHGVGLNHTLSFVTSAVCQPPGSEGVLALNSCIPICIKRFELFLQDQIILYFKLFLYTVEYSIFN